MANKIKYTEPSSYFPKSTRKYFEKPKSGKSATNKTATSKGKKK